MISENIELITRLLEMTDEDFDTWVDSLRAKRKGTTDRRLLQKKSTSFDDGGWDGGIMSHKWRNNDW